MHGKVTNSGLFVCLFFTRRPYRVFTNKHTHFKKDAQDGSHVCLKVLWSLGTVYAQQIGYCKVWVFCVSNSWTSIFLIASVGASFHSLCTSIHCTDSFVTY